MALNRQAEEIAPQVRYEWDMLRWTFKELRSELSDLSELVEDYEPEAREVFENLSTLSIERFDEERGHLIADEVMSTACGGAQINVILESFLVHARALLEFFRDKPRMDDDVVAEHFFDDADGWESEENRSAIGRQQRHIERMHKSLAHISYARIVYEGDKGWRIVELFAFLTDLWTTFWNALPGDRREWFKKSPFFEDEDELAEG